MKIKNLYITEYKGLREITLNFENNNNILDLVVLAGANGSGKTRILESIFSCFRNYGNPAYQEKRNYLDIFFQENEKNVLMKMRIHMCSFKY